MAKKIAPKSEKFMVGANMEARIEGKNLLISIDLSKSIGVTERSGAPLCAKTSGFSTFEANGQEFWFNAMMGHRKEKKSKSSR